MEQQQFFSQLENALKEIQRLKQDAAMKYLISGPYLGLTFGMTIGAMKTLQKKNYYLPPLPIFLRTTTAYSIAGLSYGLAGYYLIKANLFERNKPNQDSYPNRYLAGSVAGLSLGLVERRIGYGFLSSFIIGILACLEFYHSTFDPEAWRIKPILPPPTSS